MVSMASQGGLWLPGDFNERSAGFFHVGDGSCEWDADFSVASQDIKAFRIEANHLHGRIACDAAKRLRVVLIHVLENSGFLDGGKRVRFCKFPGAKPIDLSEAPDESDAHRLETEK